MNAPLVHYHLPIPNADGTTPFRNLLREPVLRIDAATARAVNVDHYDGERALRIALGIEPAPAPRSARPKPTTHGSELPHYCVQHPTNRRNYF